MKDIRAIPEREVVTNLQVQTLLNILGTALQGLLVPNHHIEPHHERLELDGGVKSALEMVAIENCNALTDVIRDKSRWSLEVTKVLELQAVTLNQTHIEVLRAQKKALDEMNTPSYRFKPELVRLQDGMYCAYLGDLSQPEASLVGIGKTAELAFQAFDDLFSGRVPNSMVEYLLQQEEKLKNNEKLDETRTKRVKKRKNARAKPRGHSETTSPDENGG